MEILSHSVGETQAFAQEVAKNIIPGDVLALYGELGAGKTTFVSYLVSALGLKNRVQSPTFVISRIYESADAAGEIKKVNHLDLYRLQDAPEVSELGFAEFLNEKNAVTLVEWPEVAESLLPSNTIRIFFEVVDENERKIHVQNLH